ncbi:hypothetical protein C0995_011227 [Termitomyces sp. Mi166|nr:hypothetical protein C0995_011227 [Termitomyces sp. Mi166\
MYSTGELPKDPQQVLQQPRTSVNFHALDADVLFKSSDGVIFRIHRKNLEVHATGFPLSGLNPNGEILSLTEDALTLENLFSYIYPQRYPDINVMSFEDLSKLAEAAEKYKCFSVMHICKLRIIPLVTDPPN